jgi:hypothetical protein
VWRSLPPLCTHVGVALAANALERIRGTSVKPRPLGVLLCCLDEPLPATQVHVVLTSARHYEIMFVADAHVA